MPPDIFSDPAMRALVAAVMVSDAPEDLRVPCVAAAWAVDGLLAIAPAAIAAGKPVDRPDVGTFARKSSTDDLDELKRAFQQEEQKRREEFKGKLEAFEAAGLAAKRKQKAESELNRCVEAFLAAVKKLESDQGKEDADLVAEISKNVSELQAWLGQQKGSGAATGKPPPAPPAPPPAAKGATPPSPTEQSTPPAESSSTSQTAGDAGKKK